MKLHTTYLYQAGLWYSMKIALPPTGTDIMIRLMTLVFVSSGTSCKRRKERLHEKDMASVRSVVLLIFFRMVSGSIFQNTATVTRILRHLTVAGSDLNRHNITAVVSTSGTQSLGNSSDQLTIGRTTLQKLLARLQFRTNHVGQGLEITKKNSLDNELTIQHLNILGLNVTPGVDLLHVVGNTVVIGNRSLLLGVNNRCSLLKGYT